MTLLWWLTPLSPLLAALALLLWGDRMRAGIWLCCLPALAAAWLAPDALRPGLLWPDALWGDDGFLVRGLLGFTALLWLCAGLFSLGSLKDDPRRRHFQLFWLVSLSGNLLLIIAGDALSFYVGFSLMSLSAYGLVIHRHDRQALRAGRLYMQVAMSGELVLFTGVMMAAHEAAGSTLLSDWRGADFSPLTLALLFTGLGLKAGFWPLHVWMPQAYPAAPAAGSAVLSGAMSKAGFFGLWQLLPAGSTMLQQWGEAILWLGIISVFYGALLGLTRRAAREVLAFSSVSQMGYLLLITAMAWHAPDARPALLVLLTVYAVHHGACKGALFMSAELLERARAGSLSIHWITWLTVLPALAIGGLPMTTGAAVKTLLKDDLALAGLEHYSWALQTGALVSTLIMLRALWLLRRLAAQSAGRGPTASQLTGWAIPVALTITLPWVWPAMRDATLDSLALDKLAEILWPIAAAALLAALASHRGWRIPDAIAQWRSPLLYWSIRLRRSLQRPPVPAPDPEDIPQQRLRRLERRWNRLSKESSVINDSIGVLLGVLLIIALALI